MRVEWDFSELYRFADRLRNVSNFEKHMKAAAEKIARELCRKMKQLTPVEYGDLIDGWNGNKFLATKVKNGYEVLIINKTPYARYVNDGHRVRNQKDGPYLQVKHRIKVPSPHQWQVDVSEWYVFGHFFVERGILQLNNTKQIESIIFIELKRWWEECVNG